MLARAPDSAVADIGLGLGDLFAPCAPKPHYAEHRQRLRERAASAGLAALPDYELLELYLYRSIPRRDVKPLAKALLARFGSLAGVLAATPAELCRIDGVGEAVALDLGLLHEATLRVSRGEVAKRTVITSWSQLLAYVRVALAHEPREQFHVFFLVLPERERECFVGQREVKRLRRNEDILKRSQQPALPGLATHG